MPNNFSFNSSMFKNGQESLKETIDILREIINFDKQKLVAVMPEDYDYVSDVNTIFNNINDISVNLHNLYDKSVNLLLSFQKLDLSFDSANIVNETKWYEDIWNAIKDTGAVWGQGFSSLFNGEGFDDLGEALLETGATIYVVNKSVQNGITKFGENIIDGVVFIVGSVASGATWLFHDTWSDNDLADNVMDSTLDAIRVDLTANANKDFYENSLLGQFVNEKSNLKYDSKGAQAIAKVSEFATKIAAATAVTVVSGGAAAPFVLGAFYGSGNTSETLAQNINRDSGEKYEYVNILLKTGAHAALSGVEFVGLGNLGNSIFDNNGKINAVSAGANSKAAIINNSIKQFGNRIGYNIKKVPTTKTKIFFDNFTKAIFTKDNGILMSSTLVDNLTSYYYGDISKDDFMLNVGATFAVIAFDGVFESLLKDYFIDFHKVQKNKELDKESTNNLVMNLKNVLSTSIENISN